MEVISAGVTNTNYAQVLRVKQQKAPLPSSPNFSPPVTALHPSLCILLEKSSEHAQIWVSQGPPEKQGEQGMRVCIFIYICVYLYLYLCMYVSSVSPSVLILRN